MPVVQMQGIAILMLTEIGKQLLIDARRAYEFSKDYALRLFKLLSQLFAQSQKRINMFLAEFGYTEVNTEVAVIAQKEGRSCISVRNLRPSCPLQNALAACMRFFYLTGIA